jgi:hypothetical protein
VYSAPVPGVATMTRLVRRKVRVTRANLAR